jgi:hypothetical protein
MRNSECGIQNAETQMQNEECKMQKRPEGAACRAF